MDIVYLLSIDHSLHINASVISIIDYLLSLYTIYRTDTKGMSKLF